LILGCKAHKNDIYDVTVQEDLQETYNLPLVETLNIQNPEIDIWELFRSKNSIVRVDIDAGAGIKNITFLENLTELRYLIIRRGNDDIETLEPLQHLKNLEVLIIEANFKGIIDGFIFKNLTNLELIDLHDNNVKNTEIFIDLPNIEKIHFHNYYRRKANPGYPWGLTYGVSGPASEIAAGKYRILQYRANIRNTPSTNGKTIAILGVHDEIEILENTWISERINGVWAYWYKIKIGNSTGYIFGGSLARNTLVTDIDKNGINDYFHFRTSENGTINPITDIVIYINNQRINTDVLNSRRDIDNRPFEWCIFEEGEGENDGNVFVGLVQYGRHSYEYITIYKVMSDGRIKYVKDWNERDYW
jgi:hypothetical protein